MTLEREEAKQDQPPRVSCSDSNAHRSHTYDNRPSTRLPRYWLGETQFINCATNVVDTCAELKFRVRQWEKERHQMVLIAGVMSVGLFATCTVWLIEWFFIPAGCNSMKAKDVQDLCGGLNDNPRMFWIWLLLSVLLFVVACCVHFEYKATEKVVFGIPNPDACADENMARKALHRDGCMQFVWSGVVHLVAVGGIAQWILNIDTFVMPHKFQFVYTWIQCSIYSCVSAQLACRLGVSFAVTACLSVISFVGMGVTMAFYQHLRWGAASYCTTSPVTCTFWVVSDYLFTYPCSFAALVASILQAVLLIAAAMEERRIRNEHLQFGEHHLWEHFLVETKPLYVSETAKVYQAKDLADQQNVALKIMLHENQFRKEITSRQQVQAKSPGDEVVIATTIKQTIEIDLHGATCLYHPQRKSCGTTCMVRRAVYSALHAGAQSILAVFHASCSWPPNPYWCPAQIGSTQQWAARSTIELPPSMATIDGRPGRYVLVMPLADGDLGAMMSKERFAGRDVQAIRTNGRQIALCLQKLHKCNMIHGDLKPRNVLRDTVSQELRLTDFDACAEIGEDVGTKAEGSSAHVPPEEARRQYAQRAQFLGSHNGKPSGDGGVQQPPIKASCEYEMWMFGVTMYEMLTGTRLFDTATVDTDRISETKREQLACWKGLSQKHKGKVLADCECENLALERVNAINLLASLLSPEHEDRPRSMEEVLKHPFWNCAQADSESKQETSKQLGVSLAYLLSPEFLDTAMRAAAEAAMNPELHGVKPNQLVEDPENPTFYDLKHVLAKGRDHTRVRTRARGSSEVVAKGLGFGMTCPRDEKKNCSIVDALNEQSRQEKKQAKEETGKAGKAGKATHFLSWAWSYRLRMFISALREWADKEAINPDDTFIWICFFCNNQYRLEQNSNDLDQVFKGRLKAIGHMVALIDHWEEPVYMKRIWCVYEQFVAQKLGITITVMLPPAARKSFDEELNKGKEGISNVGYSLRRIDIKNAKASVQEDEDNVKKQIEEYEKTSTSKTVEEAVKDSMRHWFQNEFRLHLKALERSLSEH